VSCSMMKLHGVLMCSKFIVNYDRQYTVHHITAWSSSSLQFDAIK
jgi:hypothetical protein